MTTPPEADAPRAPAALQAAFLLGMLGTAIGLVQHGQPLAAAVAVALGLIWLPGAGHPGSPRSSDAPRERVLLRGDTLYLQGARRQTVVTAGDVLAICERSPCTYVLITRGAVVAIDVRWPGAWAALCGLADALSARLYPSLQSERCGGGTRPLWTTPRLRGAFSLDAVRRAGAR